MVKHSEKRRKGKASEEEDEETDSERDDDKEGRNRKKRSHMRGKREKRKRSKRRRRRDDDSELSSESSGRAERESEESDSGEEKGGRRKKKVRAKADKVAKQLERKANAQGSSQQPFVWQKKIEKELEKGKDPRALMEQADRSKEQERMKEVEEVRKRREERQEELRRMEEEKERQAREKALQEAAEVERKEEEDLLQQAKVRSELRLKEGRGRPIDIVAKNIHGQGDDFNPSATPDTLFDGLTARELEELRGDIEAYSKLESHDPRNGPFWQSLLIVCHAKIREASHAEEVDRAKLRGEKPPEKEGRPGLHFQVEEDVRRMLSGKPYSELKQVDDRVRSSLTKGELADAEYWDAVLSHMETWLAMAFAREEYERRRQEWLRRQVDDQPQAGSAGKLSPPPEENGEEEGLQERERSEREDEEQKQTEAEMPPSPARVDQPEKGIEVIDEEEDRKELDGKREEVAKEAAPKMRTAARWAAMTGPTEQEDMFRAMKDTQQYGPGGVFSQIVHRAEDASETEGERIAREHALKQMGSAKEGEHTFSDEATVGKGQDATSAAYWYHDKYRPRKPKYFNRVHTGFDWNKYNKSHYNSENPPPKQVLGYKFNIFYPDLLDKSQTPTFQLEPDGSKHGETCIIRFKAGPPYEDIAFKIVNKQWEVAPQRGFKCTFERGVLQLYFNFRRARYRR